MKKITSAILFAAGLAASASAAAALPFDSGHLVTSGTTGECTLLGEAVTLNLSKNVEGAFDCNAATTDIRVMTCHAAGSNKTTTMDCAVVGFMTDGTTPIYNGACTPGTPWTITNYRIFGGSSKGGTVAPQANTGACLTAQPEAHSFFTTF